MTKPCAHTMRPHRTTTPHDYTTRPVTRAQSRATGQVALTAIHDTSVGMGPVDKFNPLARYRLTWQASEVASSEV